MKSSGRGVDVAVDPERREERGGEVGEDVEDVEDMVGEDVEERGGEVGEDVLSKDASFQQLFLREGSPLS